MKISIKIKTHFILDNSKVKCVFVSYRIQMELIRDIGFCEGIVFSDMVIIGFEIRNFILY